MKKYDIFTFFNELELLDIRLNILNDSVDYFVISECEETFSGLKKELIFEKNKSLFKKYEHKIIHNVVGSVPRDFEDANIGSTSRADEIERTALTLALNSSSVPKGEVHWLKEFYQKELLKKALTNLDDNDFCFVSDLDEIWNPNISLDYDSQSIFKLRQLPYIYYLNNRSSEQWAGTIATKYSNIKNNCLNDLRNPVKTTYEFIENGGWHFSFQGGADRIRTKLESYGHQEYNNNHIKSNVENQMQNNQDVIGRSFTFWTDESELPSYILENKEKLKNWFK